MKPNLYLSLLLFLFPLQIIAQNALAPPSLVGTWMYQKDSIRAVKIITPSYWMVFTETVKGNEANFVRAHAGTYSLDGNKYVEQIQVASWEGYGKEKTDFTVNVKQDNLHQKGSLILADGTIVPIDEIWYRVKIEGPIEDNPAVGTWNQLSSSYTLEKGEKDSHTNATATRFQIITPTHWMRISHRNNKFENVMGGTYHKYGYTIYLNFEFASIPVKQFSHIEIEQRVEGDKMYWSGIVKNGRGQQIMAFDDVFQKVGLAANMVTPKPTKSMAKK